MMSRPYNIFLSIIIALTATLILSVMSAFGEEVKWRVSPPDVQLLNLEDPVVKEVLSVVSAQFAWKRQLNGAGYAEKFEWFITSGMTAETAVAGCKCVGMTYYGPKQVVVHDVAHSVWLHLLAHEAVHVLQYSYGVEADGGVMAKLTPELRDVYLFEVREREAEMVARWTVDYLIRNSEQFRKAIGVK